MERESTFTKKLQPISFKLSFNDNKYEESSKPFLDERPKIDYKFFHPETSLPITFGQDTYRNEMSLHDSTLVLANSIQNGGVQNLKNVQIEFLQNEEKQKNSEKSSQAYDKFKNIKKMNKKEGRYILHLTLRTRTRHELIICNCNCGASYLDSVAIYRVYFFITFKYFKYLHKVPNFTCCFQRG